MARDYYAEARSLAAELRADAAALDRSADAAALDRSANSIDEVISAGFTATEILMGLRSQLRDVASEGQPWSEKHRALAEDLANGIDEALA